MASLVSGNSDEVYNHLRHLYHKHPAVPSLEPAQSVSCPDDSSVTQNSISIASLPVELLTAVFDNCVSKGERSDPPVPTLLHIVSVSRQWRAIALAAPHLWARIYLHDPRMMHVAMVQQWLERSQAYPLTLSVQHSTSREYPVDAETTNAILTLSLQHLPRWRSVSFHLPKFTTFPPLPSASVNPPLLERVDVDDGGCFDTASAKLFWQIVFASPSIRSVSWSQRDDVHARYLPNLLGLDACNWEKLTHIQGEFCVDDTSLEVFSRCRALEVLDIIGLDPSTTPALYRPRFELPRLRSLALNGGTLMGLFLDTFFAPALEHLELRFWKNGLQSLADFLDRSSWTLDSMKIYGMGVPKRDHTTFCTLLSLRHVKALEVTINRVRFNC